jgi:hypothetical protein
MTTEAEPAHERGLRRELRFWEQSRCRSASWRRAPPWP